MRFYDQADCIAFVSVVNATSAEDILTDLRIRKIQSWKISKPEDKAEDSKTQSLASWAVNLAMALTSKGGHRWNSKWPRRGQK
jgi:hypothetical protein